MTEREALKLALEALEDYRSGCQTKYDADKAITAIKEALAQPEREIDPSTTFDEVAKGLQVSRMAIAALDALTIEQRRSINEPLLKAQLFLKAAARVFKEALAQPEQEPVAIPRFGLNPYNGMMYESNRGPWCLYKDTTPPQRTWVGLTKKETSDFVDQYWANDAVSMKELIGFVEAKLKQKNGYAEE